MSSREGNVVLASEILNELADAASERTEDAVVTEQVAQAAMRYLILRQGIRKQYCF